MKRFIISIFLNRKKLIVTYHKKIFIIFDILLQFLNFNININNIYIYKLDITLIINFNKQKI